MRLTKNINKKAITLMLAALTSVTLALGCNKSDVIESTTPVDATPAVTTEAPTESTTPVETTTKPVETTPAPTTEAPTTTIAPTTEAPTETTTVEPETTTEAPTTTAEPETTTEAASTPVVVGSIPRNVYDEYYNGVVYAGNDTYNYQFVDTDYDMITGNPIILNKYTLKSGETVTIDRLGGNITPVFKVYRPIIDNELYLIILDTDAFGIKAGYPEAIMYKISDNLVYGEYTLVEYKWVEDMNVLLGDWSTITNDNLDNLVLDDYKQYLRNDWSEEDFPTVESLMEYYRTTDSMLENAIKEAGDFSVETIRARYDWSDQADWCTAEEIEEQRLKGEALIEYYKSVGLLAE